MAALRRSILGLVLHFGLISIYMYCILDHVLVNVYNIYITVETDSGESAIPLVEILIGVSTSGDSDLLFKGCNCSFH